MIEWNEVFNLIEQKDKKKQIVYRCQFKHTGEIMIKSMSTNKYTVQKWAYRWIKANHRQAADIVFELNVLTSH